MNIKRKYIDGVGSITLMGDMVHMQLFNFIPGKQEDRKQQLEMEINEELIMTPQTFLRAFSAMQNVPEQFEKAGIALKIKNKEEPVISTEIKEPESSPNFS